MSESILERVAAGERTAVETCLDRYGDLVWSLALRFCRARSDAEDAVQEIFIEIWKNAARFDRAVASETTFIAMLARRRLIDRLRKQQREPDQDELGPETAVFEPDVQRDLETRDEAGRATKLLATLKPEARRVLELAIYHGLSHGKISDHLGLPLGTVKTHARRGLIRLRKMMNDPDPGEVTP